MNNRAPKLNPDTGRHLSLSLPACMHACSQKVGCLSVGIRASKVWPALRFVIVRPHNITDVEMVSLSIRLVTPSGLEIRSRECGGCRGISIKSVSARARMLRLYSGSNYARRTYVPTNEWYGNVHVCSRLTDRSQSRPRRSSLCETETENIQTTRPVMLRRLSARNEVELFLPRGSI